MLHSRYPATNDALRRLFDASDRAAFERNFRSRIYHGLDHIEFMFQVLNQSVNDCIIDPKHISQDALTLAILFHDYVYDVGAVNNEERSAEAMLDFVGRVKFLVSDETVEVARQAIEIAPVCLPLPGLAMSAVGEEEMTMALLHDLDFAILAAEPVKYMWYCSSVCAEYVPERCTMIDYVCGRVEFLKSALKTDIFCYPQMHSRLHEVAVFNIMHEISWLDSGIYEEMVEDEIEEVIRLASKSGLYAVSFALGMT